MEMPEYEQEDYGGDFSVPQSDFPEPWGDRIPTYDYDEDDGTRPGF